jgi:hypothetical protein
MGPDGSNVCGGAAGTYVAARRNRVVDGTAEPPGHAAGARGGPARIASME